MAEKHGPDRDDALNDFWNDLVRASGAQDAVGESLSSETAAAVRRLHALGAAPPPASSRERVRRGLRATNRQIPNGKEPTMHAMTGTLRPGPLQLPPPGVARPRMRWLERPLIFATVAALLLAAIASGFGASRLLDRSDDGGRAGIPAAVMESSPTAASDELLLELAIPAELVPASTTIVPAMGSNTLQPGASGIWEPICCSGPMLEYVVSGAYTVRAEEPIQLIRAGGAEEEIPAGTEVTLEAGDALLTDITTVMESANHGSEPVELLNWFLVDTEGEVFGGKAFPGWVQNGEDFPWAPFDLAGPLTVRLRLVQMEPGASVSPAPGALQMALATAGQPGWLTFPKDGSAVANSFVDATLAVYVLTLESADSGPATPES